VGGDTWPIRLAIERWSSTAQLPGEASPWVLGSDAPESRRCEGEQAPRRKESSKEGKGGRKEGMEEWRKETMRPEDGRKKSRSALPWRLALLIRAIPLAKSGRYPVSQRYVRLGLYPIERRRRRR
jgi:hypothetical protein